MVKVPFLSALKVKDCPPQESDTTISFPNFFSKGFANTANEKTRKNTPMKIFKKPDLRLRGDDEDFLFMQESHIIDAEIKKPPHGGFLVFN